MVGSLKREEERSLGKFGLNLLNSLHISHHLSGKGEGANVGVSGGLFLDSAGGEVVSMFTTISARLQWSGFGLHQVRRGNDASHFWPVSGA